MLHYYRQVSISMRCLTIYNISLIEKSEQIVHSEHSVAIQKTILRLHTLHTV